MDLSCSFIVVKTKLLLEDVVVVVVVVVVAVFLSFFRFFLGFITRGKLKLCSEVPDEDSSEVILKQSLFLLLVFWIKFELNNDFSDNEFGDDAADDVVDDDDDDDECNDDIVVGHLWITSLWLLSTSFDDIIFWLFVGNIKGVPWAYKANRAIFGRISTSDSSVVLIADFKFNSLKIDDEIGDWFKWRPTFEFKCCCPFRKLLK